MGPDRHHAALRLRDGHADLVAAARGALLPRRAALGHAPRARAPTGGAPRCSSGAPGSSSRGLVFSFAQGHHPPVLHRRARARDRRARRHRRRLGVARSARTLARPRWRSPRRSRHDVGLGVRPARPHARPGSRGCASRCVVGGLASAGARRVGPAVWQRQPRVGRARPARSRSSSRSPRPAAYAVADRLDRAQRVAAVGRPRRLGRHARPGRRRSRLPGGRAVSGFPGRAASGGGAPPAGGAGGHGAGVRHRHAWDRRGAARAGRRSAACSTRARRARRSSRLLRANASSYRWVAAVVGANSAAGVQLAAGSPVMAIGGFNGTDPSPTLAQFKAYVAAGKIHYFLSGGCGGGGVGSSRARARSRPGSTSTSPPRPSAA